MKKTNKAVIAIAVVVVLIFAFIYLGWPLIQKQVVTKSCKAAYGDEYWAEKNNDYGKKAGTQCGGSQCINMKWYCINSKGVKEEIY